jgi:hypothetical protein
MAALFNFMHNIACIDLVQILWAWTPKSIHTYIHTYIYTHIQTYIHTQSVFCRAATKANMALCVPYQISELWSASLHCDQHHYKLLRSLLCLHEQTTLHFWGPLLTKSPSTENYNASGHRVWSRSKEQAADWKTEELWFDSWKGQRDHLFSQTSRLAPGLTKPLPQCVTETHAKDENTRTWSLSLTSV